MTKRTICAALPLTILAIYGEAHAEDTHASAHVGAGAAHAIGGDQQRELGMGGGAHVALELPLASVIGVQASAGTFLLSRGESPMDPGIAPRDTGTAFFGTLGARIHAGSFWIDGGAGIARTGNLFRPVVDVRAGWAFRPSAESSWTIGPFAGYTHVIQPDGALRDDDARVVSVGFEIGFGSRDRRPTVAPQAEPPPPAAPPEPIAEAPALPEDHDGQAEVFDEFTENGVTLLADRILMDDVVHFEFSSARVRSKSHWMLFRLAKFINAHPEVLEVSIEGHADAVGTDEFNQDLSQARADSVQKMLVKFGADPSRVATVGFGKAHPRVMTLAADERNRRVEFWVKRGGR